MTTQQADFRYQIQVAYFQHESEEEY